MTSYGATVSDHVDAASDPDLEPRPRRGPPGYWPDFTTYYLRYPPGMRDVVRVVFGVSSDGSPAFVARVVEALQGTDGARTVERGRVIVPEDSGTLLVFAYWDDTAAHARWAAAPTTACALARDEGASWWCETADLPLTHTEAHFGVRTRETGLGRLPGTEHAFCPMVGYWGSGRDRIPAAADDEFVPGAGTSAVGEPDDRRTVAPAHVATIRTSQDWQGAPLDHLEWYREEVEPVLRAGVEFLSGEPDEARCLTALYVQETDLDGVDVDRTCVLAHFRSLDDLEGWARDHPTHHAIFASGMQMVRRFGEDLGIRLFHEVSVLPEGRFRGRYVRCADDTGLLRRFDSVA